VIEEEENGGPVVSERVQVSYIYMYMYACIHIYISHPLNENQPSDTNCLFCYQFDACCIFTALHFGELILVHH